MTPPLEDLVARFAERLRVASRVTVLTGAGVSAASGVPTFRGQDGLWSTHRAESLATAAAFVKDPKLVWEWYAWRRGTIAACKPNRAHEILATWSRRFTDFALLTQNVDGLHELAGTSGVVRMHGSLWEVSCWDRCSGAPERWEDRSTRFEVLPPRCPHCGGHIRPGVVWFGESLDPEVLDRCDTAQLRHLRHDRHLVGRLPGRVPRARSQAARRVHGGGQSRGDTGIEHPRSLDTGLGRARAPRCRTTTVHLTRTARALPGRHSLIACHAKRASTHV